MLLTTFNNLPGIGGDTFPRKCRLSQTTLPQPKVAVTCHQPLPQEWFQQTMGEVSATITVVSTEYVLNQVRVVHLHYPARTKSILYDVAILPSATSVKRQLILAKFAQVAQQEVTLWTGR